MRSQQPTPSQEALSQEPPSQETSSQENMLPELKGAPLSVLLALWRGGPGGRKELIQRTGWKKDAVSAALKRLVRLKLVARHNHREWGVAKGVSVPRLLGVAGLNGAGPPESPQEREQRPTREATNGDERRKMRRSHAAGGERGAAPAVVDERNRRSRGREARPDRRSRAGAETAAGRENRPTRTEAKRIERSFAEDEDVPYVTRQARKIIAAEERRLSRPARAVPDRTVLSHARDDHDLSDELHPDHVLNKNKKDDNDHEQVQAVIQSLQALSPPFDRAEAWLKSVPLGLVARWLAYLAVIPRSQRDAIHNEAAFIRSRVRKRMEPPLSEYSERQSARYSYDEAPAETEEPLESLVEIGDECPRCGRTYYDTIGNCLVCQGVIKV